MQTLTDKPQKLAEIAERHGVSNAAASELLAAIATGGGRQAQFNHPELGGMGQWSNGGTQGGMIMIGDMFNHGLKARVADLCNDLATAWQEFPPESSWPAELGTPAASGSQNDMRYAIFPETRRLAIEHNGQTTVYDTQDYRIGGISQQQGSDQSLKFRSQSGEISLADLQIVGLATESPAPALPANGTDQEIFSRIERLAELHERNVLTAEEFSAKKAELLARL